jgi:hypothetical protein
MQDQERIRVTRHNAKVLEQRDTERRLQLEGRAAEEAQRIHDQQQHQRIEPSMSQTAASSSAQSPRVTAVPTSAVSEEGVEQDKQQRHVDMEVWEASRRRVEEMNAQQNDAFTRRAGRRAEMNQQDAERDRAKRAMNRSPLEAFDVSFDGDQQQQQPEEKQLKPRLGRQAGADEQWKPQGWSPTPSSRR